MSDMEQTPHQQPATNPGELAASAVPVEERLRDPDSAYTTALHLIMQQVILYELKEDGTAQAFLPDPDVNTLGLTISDILDMRDAIDPDSKLSDEKLTLRMVQQLERDAATSAPLQRLEAACKLGLLASAAKPDPLPPNLTPEKVQDTTIPLRKRPKESMQEKAFRCAVLALRKLNTPRVAEEHKVLHQAVEQAVEQDVPRHVVLESHLSNPAKAASAADYANHTALFAYAGVILRRLMADTTTAEGVQEEIAAYAAAQQTAIAEQELSAEPEQPELPVQYVDWGPVPPSSIEALGITLPPQAKTGQRRTDTELVRLHPRDRERFKLLAEIAIECCGDWEWGEESGKVRIVRARLRSGGEGKRRRLNRYRLAILPKHLDDERVVEDAVAIGRYGNAALVWLAETGIVEGKTLYEWPEVFQGNKPQIVNMGAKWLKHSPHIKERILAALTQGRQNRPAAPDEI